MDNIKFNKLLNEKYYLLKDIAKKYDYNEELLDMMTFIYISFYMDLGKNCDFPLYDLFNKVKIIYDNGTVNEISIKNGFGSIPSDAAAVTMFNPNFKVFNDSSLKQNPQLILLGTHVNQYLATPICKLEMLVHEVRHALMGYYNTNFLIDESTYYMRTGLQESFCVRDSEFSEKITTTIIARTLDEIINTYITEILVNGIMSLKKYKIENNSLKSYLESLKTGQVDGKYRALGYNFEVRLLYPLLLNDVFINMTNLHQFDGQIEIIKEFINNSTDLCDYQKFCELLDSIFDGNSRYQLEVKNNNIDFVNNHINNINKVKSIVLDLNQNISDKTLEKNII